MDKRPRILVVDDTHTNVVILDKVLASEGFSSVGCENSEEAFGVAKAERPDLILLDIMMPGKDGFEVCSMLKADPLTKATPVIFLTALDDLQSKVKGLEYGAVDYITKPFKKSEVVARIRRHIETRRVYEDVISAQSRKRRQIREAQRSILTSPEELPEAKFAVKYASALEAGGDFYDVLPIGESVFGYFVCDISGHDIHASFSTASLKALLTHYGRSHPKPTAIMGSINRVMTNLLAEGEHLTACYVEVDRGHSRLTLVNAGHIPMVLLRRDGTPEIVEAVGDILGVFQDVHSEPLEMPIQPGDRFFLYTDGLVEKFGTMKRSRKRGTAVLLQSCIEARHLPLCEAVEKIADSMLRGEGSQEDDVVLLGVDT